VGKRIDHTGLEKFHFWMRSGLWLCEAEGIIGIGATPPQALNDWTLELLDSFDEPLPQSGRDS
jgi:hypothetical protein